MSLRDRIHHGIVRFWVLSSLLVGLVAAVIGFGVALVLVVTFLKRQGLQRPDSVISVLAVISIVAGVFLLFLGAFVLGRRRARRRRLRSGP